MTEETRQLCTLVRSLVDRHIEQGKKPIEITLSPKQLKLLRQYADELEVSTLRKHLNDHNVKIHSLAEAQSA